MPVAALDCAGWRRDKRLDIPKSMSLLRLEPVGSGLNSMKKVLGNMNPGKLANRLFASVEDVRGAVNEAWSEFVGRTCGIALTATRERVAFRHEFAHSIRGRRS